MAEMTIEQKAARYDEIIKELRDFYRDYDTVSRLIDVKAELANLVPELKESEDERIRKELIQFFKEKDEEDFEDWIPKAKVLDWFEKQAKLIIDNSADTSKPYGQRKECADCQFNYAGECKGSCSMKRGEQNPTDKVEPKFKVGDWVMINRPVLITKVEDMPYNRHQYWTSDGTWFGDATNAKLWSIDDAKDGDILIDTEGMTTPFKFRRISHNKVDGSQIIAYGGVDDEGKFQTCNYDEIWCGIDNVAPATKEQIQFLNERMDIAGYYWSEEEKMYVKYEINPITDKI